MSLTAPSKITVPWANTGVNRTSIPTASQISVTPGAASWTDGFPPLCMTPIASGGIPPAGPDFNGVLYSLSQSLQWLQAGSGYQFDGSFATAVGGYPQWAMVQRSDGKGYWLNTVANNSTNPESVTNSGWIPAASNASSAITMTSSNVTLTALQAGAYIITLSGALTANLQLIFPTWVQEWLVVNNCTGSFSVTCKTASGTGVAISTGSNAIVYGDGTNINSASAMVLASSTEAQALTNNAKAITPATLASAFQGSNQSLVANGYQKLPGGMIFQWGVTAELPDGQSATITLPITFPSQCLAAYSSLNKDVNGDAGSCRSSGATVISTSQIKVSYNDTFGSTSPIYWFAIGR